MTEPTGRTSWRGVAKPLPPSLASVEIPTPPFLYTLDQVAMIVGWSKQKLHARTFYLLRSTGVKHYEDLEAFNMAARGEKPDWRVSEHELIRWLRRHGYKPIKKKD